MRHEQIDTDGRLDKCHCGAFAKFVCDTEHQPRSWRVDCTECPETTDWVFCESSALTTWNQMMRSSNAAGSSAPACSDDPSITTAYCPHCGECMFPAPDQWGDIVECETTGKAFRLVPESRLPRRKPNK